MSSLIAVAIALIAANDSTKTYDITEVILYYHDTTEYRLTISQDDDSDSGYYYLDWVDQWDGQSRETGFEYAGYIGAYDFENCGLGVYSLTEDGLAGFRLYPVVMRLLQVTSDGSRPLELSEIDLSGFWNVEITGGSRRVKPTTMDIFYREDGDYWDSGEFDSDFNQVSGGWGLVAKDVLIIGFQNLDVNGITLKMYEIRGDTLEGRWVEAYYDYEQNRTIIEYEGTERAVKTRGIE